MNQVLIKADNLEKRTDVIKNVASYREILKDSVINEVSINEADQLFGEDLFKILSNILLLAGIIVLTIGTVIVLQIVLTVVMNKMKDFGVFRSFGFKNSHIVKYILSIGLSIGISSLLLGVAAGAVIGNLLTSMFARYLNLFVGLKIDFGAIFTGAGIGILFSLIATVPAITIVLKEPIVSALNFSRVSGARFPSLKLLNIKNKLIFRQISKTRFRVFMTLLFISVAGSAFIAAGSFRRSFDGTMSGIMDKFYKAQYLIDFADYYPLNDIKDTLMRELPDGTILEPYVVGEAVKVQASDETWRPNTTIIGVNPDSDIWNLKGFVKQGRLYSISDEAVLGERLASLIGKSVGDTITIHAKKGFSTTFNIVGIARIYEARGEVVYVLPGVLRDIAVQGYENTEYFKHYGYRLPDSAEIDNYSRIIKDNAEAIDSNVQFTPLSVLIKQGKSMTGAISGLVFFMSVMISLSAVFGLLTNIRLDIWGKRKEIATQIALGFKKSSIIWHFVKKYLAHSFIAWLISVFIGFFLSVLVMYFFDKQITPVEFLFSYTSIIVVAVFLPLFCILIAYMSTLQLIKNFDIPEVLKVQT